MLKKPGPKFERALVYAARAHAGQRRKGKATPYLAHLLGVTAIVLEHGGSATQAIAALLHDAVEDQGGLPRLRDIRRRFGPRVARIVLACTDSFTVPKPPWRARKEAYLRELRGASRDSLLVSAADKLHNAREINADLRAEGPRAFARFTGRRDGTLWYYRSLARVLRARRGPHQRIAAELSRAVAEMAQRSGKGK